MNFSKFQVRDSVLRMTADQWETALETTGKIPQTLYRCQALAHVAHICPDSLKKQKIIDDALKLAWTEKEPFNILEACVWPLSVQCSLNHRGMRVSQQVERLLNEINKLSHPVRKMDALCFLALAVREDKTNFCRVLEEFKAACKGAESWRVSHDLTVLAGHARVVDPKLAEELIAMISSEKLQAKARRYLARLDDGKEVLS